MDLFKWMPHKEQEICERKLIKVMKRLRVEIYNFNWDRSSCYIEFQYKENSYRLEHSTEKAKEKGIVRLKNGLDCLNELVDSLEDLCQITERGTFRLETWLYAMKQTQSPEQVSEYLEEVHIRYKPLVKQTHMEPTREEEFMTVSAESRLGDFDDSPILRRSPRS